MPSPSPKTEGQATIQPAETSVAIGGITPDNCAPLIEAGADFLAVSNAVWSGDEVAAVEAFAAKLR